MKDSMLTTIEGVYHDGKIELSEIPQDIQEEMIVLVTFLSSMKQGNRVNLPSRGIDRDHAADLRARLRTFAEDWDSPQACHCGNDHQQDVSGKPSKSRDHFHLLTCRQIIRPSLRFSRHD